MEFHIQRDVILKALQQLSGIVDKKQTLPVLSNILVQTDDNAVTLTATDIDLELITKVECEVKETGEVTIPARKWLDICRNLQEDAVINVSVNDNKAVLTSGKSHFTLITLSAEDYPSTEKVETQAKYKISQKTLKDLLEATHFSMAQQDVRYYLNGLMMEMSPSLLRGVTTDGHRLALKDTDIDIDTNEEGKQIIAPRKCVQELMRLLSDSDEEEVEIITDAAHIRLTMDNMQFTSKLIEGRFPDYKRVIPEGGNNIVVANRELLQRALARVAIFSEQNFRLFLTENKLKMEAINRENDKAEDELAIEYSGDEMEVGFNADYLLETVGAIKGEQIKIVLKDTSRSCIVKAPDDDKTFYVIMPTRI